MADKVGILYLCATPIGNLEDMTFRAVRMMGQVQLIAAEDTRHTRKLLSHYDIHTPLISYHEHNKFTKGPELIAHLLAGEDLLLVSDAGLPGIADPGSHLAELAIAAGIIVTPLPGANAALSGLICSGLDTTQFLFVGFLPKTTKKRQEVLAQLVNHSVTLLFYESPHRIKATLNELSTAFGAMRRATLARELTKKFEEFIRGTLGSLGEHLAKYPPRGEFCIIVAGADLSNAAPESKEQLPCDPTGLTEYFMQQGIEKKAAMKQAAQALGISKRDVYQAILTQKNHHDA